MSPAAAEPGTSRALTQAARDGETRNIGLDAARLLASLTVLVAHAVWFFLPMFGLSVPATLLMGGYFGVELFFVLSGFLIGHLLIAIAATDATPRGWLVFMVRRWMRTLPVYYLWLLVQPLVLPLPENLPGKLLHYATMTQNLAWPMPADEWFNQSWTLAVEEWFYLLFSAVLLAAVALTRSRRAVWLAILAFLAVPALVRIALPPPDDFEHDMYHVVLLRLDAIAYGVALAKLKQSGSFIFRFPLLAAVAGLALVGSGWEQDIYGAWFRVTRMQFLLGQLFITSVGWCLFLAGISALRLRWRPLVWLIRTGSHLSYGIYLMHLTVIVWVVTYGRNHGYGPVAMLAAATCGTILLPYLSYRFFEAPLMALRPPQTRRAAMPAQGAVS